MSRQAITKWQTGKGIPDVDNLKVISKVLNDSIDFLLDDEEVLDKTVIKEQINLDNYVKEGGLRSKKDAVVYSKYPNADITPLLAKKIVGNKFEIGDYKYRKCKYKVEK